MGTRGLKICKACRRSFEPQLTDQEIRELWFTEEQLAADQEHIEMAGHGHLMAPYQELCGKCSTDPDVELVHGSLFGPPVYRKRGRVKKLKVSEQKPDTVLFPSPQDSLDAMGEFLSGTHKVKTSDGFEMTIEGPLPPQDVIDAMGAAVRSGAVEGTIKPAKKARVTIIKKRPSLLARLFGKRKKK